MKLLRRVFKLSDFWLVLRSRNFFWFAKRLSNQYQFENPLNFCVIVGIWSNIRSITGLINHETMLVQKQINCKFCLKRNLSGKLCKNYISLLWTSKCCKMISFWHFYDKLSLKNNQKLWKRTFYFWIFHILWAKLFLPIQW